MKRNEMFMLSYIIFLIVCCIARLLGCLPAWAKIVTATTISSGLFAIAEFLFAAASDYREMNKNMIEFANRFKPKVKLFKEIMSSFNVKKDVFYEIFKNRIEPDVWKKFISSQQENFSLAREFVDIIDDKVPSRELKIERYEKAGNIITVIGFLLFFCIIVFDPLAEKSILIQDYLTVISFATILISQYFSSKHREKLSENSAMFDRVNKICDSWLENIRSTDELMQTALEEHSYAD